MTCYKAHVHKWWCTVNSACQHTLSQREALWAGNRESPGAIISEWLRNYTENSCTSTPHTVTLHIFHLVYLTVEVSLLGGNKAMSLGIYWLECGEFGGGGGRKNWCWAASPGVGKMTRIDEHFLSSAGTYSLLPGLWCPRSFPTKEPSQFEVTEDGSADLFAIP